MSDIFEDYDTTTIKMYNQVPVLKPKEPVSFPSPLTLFKIPSLQLEANLLSEDSDFQLENSSEDGSSINKQNQKVSATNKLRKNLIFQKLNKKSLTSVKL